MPDIELIALDLDGTLLGSDKAVPARNVEAVREAHRLGVHVVLASGRMVIDIEPTADAIGLDLVLASCNGAKVVGERAGGRELLHHQPLPADRAAAIVEAARAHHCLVNFYHCERLYAQTTPALVPLVELYRSRGGVPHVEIGLHVLRQNAPTKLVLVAEPDELERILVELADCLKGLSCVRSMPEYLEIMAPGVSKGHALGAVAERVGVPLERCMAIGDAGNDVHMLELAGLGVAVANAFDSVKAIANHVTLCDNDEGGVAEAIERFVL